LVIGDWWVGRKTRRAIDFVSPRGLSAPVLSRFCACGKIDGSKPARINLMRNEYHGRAEFFAASTELAEVLPIRNLVFRSFRTTKKSPGEVPGVHQYKARAALATVFLGGSYPDEEPDFFPNSTGQEIRVLLSWNTWCFHNLAVIGHSYIILCANVGL
jgi:hypothetical protein